MQPELPSNPHLNFKVKPEYFRAVTVLQLFLEYEDLRFELMLFYNSLELSLNVSLNVLSKFQIWHLSVR